MRLLLTTPFRNLQGYNKFSILNIVGLCIAFTFLNLITVFVIREFNYDKFHKKSKSIYLLETSLKNDDGTIEKGKYISLGQVESIQSGIAGVSGIAFLNYSYFDWDNGTWLKYRNSKYQLGKMAFTNAAFAGMFSFETVSGDLEVALNDPRSLVLTKDNARKIFGNENPIGKEVLLNNQLVTVKAVVDGNSQKSSIQFDGLINYKAAQYFTGHAIEDYSNLAFLETNTSTKNVESVIKRLMLEEFPLKAQQLFKTKFNINLIPLTESYFSDGDAFDPMLHGNKTIVYVILAIGILILLLAIINYVNLFFAASFKRHKEIAIKSISGAKYRNLIFQFIYEGIVISLIAYTISILVSSALLPWFNFLIDYPISFDEFLNPTVIMFSVSTAAIVGILSGILPSSWIMHLSPAHLFRGKSQSTSKYTVWQYLVLFQMIISITLITGTIVISRQMHFVNQTDLGFETHNVITLPAFKLDDRKEPFLQLVDTHPGTESRAQSSTYLNTFNRWGGELIEAGQKKDISYLVIHASADFLKTLKVQLIKGRNFERSDSTDLNTCLINKTAVQQFSLSDPLKAKIDGRQIIGIVEDMHIQSLHYQMEPVVIFNSPLYKTGLTSIRFKAANNNQVAEYVQFLKTSWEKLSPEKPFEFEFLDQRLEKMYEKDMKLMKAFSSFSALAIIIACLGLFGLVSFVAESKVQEIGIRKVNGARVIEIMTMLNTDFIKWVFIAFVIASPISWYAMHKWLGNFAYKTDLNWWVFALAGFIALFIALVTVSWQSWRAATRNPVESLRYE